MKKIKLFSFLLLLTLFFNFNLTSIHALDTPLTPSEDKYAYENLYYDKMDVKIDVTEQGRVKVHTKIDAVFNYLSRGVQIFVPQRYEMEFVDPETNYRTKKSYYWKVENLTNYSNYDMNSETIGNALRIRFGDPDIYLDGLHSYEFSYEIQMYDLEYKDLEMFYWNILGSGFEVIIDKFTFEVTLPKPVEEYPLYIHSGQYRESDNQYVTYTFDDNQHIKGESLMPLPRFTAVTAQIDVPRGYFDFPTRIDFTFITNALLGIGALVSVMWFWKYGKDDPMVITIEHQPPTGLSSAQVGYIYDGFSNQADVLSLIVDWASHGYLTLEEITKKNMRISKLKDIPNSMPEYEQEFFNALFKSGDVVETKDLEEVFYTHVRYAVSGLNDYFKKKGNRVFNLKSNIRQGLSIFLAALLFSIFIGYRIYYRSFLVQYGLIAFAVSFVTSLFFVGIQVYFFQGFKSIKPLKKVLFLFLSLLSTAIHFAGYVTVLVVFEAFDYRFFIALLLFFITVVCAINMSKRTPYGSENLGKILGLKRFIEDAEKERLEFLVHENPTYFYDVLPYAYVLGVSSVWSDKFEGIAMEPPVGYTGDQFSPVEYTNNLNRMMYRTTRSLTSSPAPQGGSSGGFGGGSFSGGGGGGGFSGGGFGGGGGGGW